jgi:SAM-dependent methyltransferase
VELTPVQLIKSAARALPAGSPVRRTLTVAYGDWKIRCARRTLQREGGGQPAYLSPDLLPSLIAENFRPPDVVRYDSEGLLLRAKEKVERLSGGVGLAGVRRALELGAWDAMVGRELASRGIHAVGLDVVTAGLDARATQGGVHFVQSDAAAIALATGSVDLVYSFGSLEHFPQPDRAVAEVHRVLRRGGRAFFNFGPLYLSPYGRHAYRQIPVPFCHLLFSEQTLHAWADSAGLTHDWPYVNGWSLQQYRGLWGSLEDRFRVISQEEHSTGGVGMELVARFPQCFRGRDVDALLVSHVDIVVEKR